MDLWHQISFEIPELHSMLLFVAFSSFSPEVKAQLSRVLLDCLVSPCSLSTNNLRLQIHSLISYF